MTRKEAEKILDEYWKSPIKKGRTTPRKDFYSKNYIEGFNFCVMKFVDKRMLNKTVLRTALGLD